MSIDVTAIPAELTGAGRYVMELAAALYERGDLDLTLITRRRDGPRWDIGPSLVTTAPTARPVRLVWEQLTLPRVLRQLALDVHHAPHYTMPERTEVPTVVTIHDMTFFDHPEWHQRRKVPVFRRAIARAAERAAGLICVSETTAARFRDRFPNAAPVHVAPHGVNHHRFTAIGDAAADEELIAALDIRPPYVAFVGTLEPRKDVGTLVRAFDRVADRHPDLTLVIAGRRGWGDPGIDAALAESAHADRVRRLGYVDLEAVPALLRRAAAVAYPSRDEGFGLPVLEALACGAPVVTTAGTVMEEVAGDAAVLVAPGDAAVLADALDALVSGGDRVERQRERGVVRAAAYTWTASADRHAAVYRSVG